MYEKELAGFHEQCFCILVVLHSLRRVSHLFIHLFILLLCPPVPSLSQLSLGKTVGQGESLLTVVGQKYGSLWMSHWFIIEPQRHKN